MIMSNDWVGWYWLELVMAHDERWQKAFEYSTHRCYKYNPHLYNFLYIFFLFWKMPRNPKQINLVFFQFFFFISSCQCFWRTNIKCWEITNQPSSSQSFIHLFIHSYIQHQYLCYIWQFYIREKENKLKMNCRFLF